MKLFKKALAILALAVLSVTTLTACGGNDATAQTQEQSVVVAKINDEPIYKTMLDNQIAQYGMSEYYMNLYYGEDYTSDPEIVEQYNEFKDDVLETIIEAEIFVLKAKQTDGITVTSEEIDNMIAETKAGFASEDEFNTALEQSNLTLDQFRGDIERNLYVKKLVDYYAQNQSTVKDSDVEDYYKANPDSFKTANIYHILVDSEEKAQEVLNKYKSGTSFADLAAEYGTDGTKDNGGALGEIPFDTTQYDEDFMAGAKKLGEGEVSEPVQTQFGWHIIKVDNIQVKPLEEARDEVLAMLKEIEASQMIMNSLEGWKEEFKVERFPETYYTQLTEPKATEDETTNNDATNNTNNNATTNNATDTAVIGGANDTTSIKISDNTNAGNNAVAE